PPQGRATSPRGIVLRTRKTRGRHPPDNFNESGAKRSTPWRAWGKLAPVRRAAPRPGRHPLGGSAQVLLRRGAVTSHEPTSGAVQLRVDGALRAPRSRYLECSPPP